MIIRDYIIKEVLRTFVGVFLVIFVIILSTQLLRSLSAVAHGKIALDFLLTLIFLKNLESLTLVIPLTFFLSIVLALSRLYQDSEMVAMSACGIGPGALLKNVLIVVFAFIFLEMGLSLVIGPMANYVMQFTQDSYKSEASLELINAGQFNLADNGKRVLYAESMPESLKLSNVFLHVDNEKSESVLASNEAQIRHDNEKGVRYVVFKEGNRFDGQPGTRNYRVINFNEYGVLMAGKQLTHFDPDRASLNTTEIWSSAKLIHKLELQWRISQVLMMIILAMLAVPLSKTAPRKGRYDKMALAILLYIVYSNLLVVATNWMRKGVVPESFGFWWVHIVFFLVFLFWFMQQIGVFNKTSSQVQS